MSDTRDRIIDAAYRLAGTGIENINISSVARDAGVTRPTVYAHFPGGARSLKAAALLRATALSDLRVLEIFRLTSGVND